MKRVMKIAICVMLVISTMAFLGCEKKDKKSVTNNEKLENLKLPLGKDDFIQFSIYFDGSKDGTSVQIVKDE